MPKHIDEAAHYWFGKWVDELQLKQLLQQELAEQINRALRQPFPFEQLLTACQSLSDELSTQGQSYQTLQHYICGWLDDTQTQAVLEQLQGILERDYLQTKLRSELGTERPNVLERRYPDRQYEMWAPLGCVGWRKGHCLHSAASACPCASDCMGA